MNEEKLAKLEEMIKNIVPIPVNKEKIQLKNCIALCESMKANGFTRKQAKDNLQHIPFEIVRNKALFYVFGHKEVNND